MLKLLKNLLGIKQIGGKLQIIYIIHNIYKNF